MDLSTSRLAMIIHQERLAEAANARKWARSCVTESVWNRIRAALSTRLIRWGEQLRVPVTPIKVRL
jgi:hypothetical protein